MNKLQEIAYSAIFSWSKHPLTTDALFIRNDSLELANKMEHIVLEFANWCRYGKHQAYKNILREATLAGKNQDEITKELFDYFIENEYVTKQH